jgi:hypothetical protein
LSEEKYVDGSENTIPLVSTQFLNASNGVRSTLAVSGVTESMGGSGSIVIK